MAYSEPAGMYLNEFAILEQPVDCAALIGDKASFSVTAYGDDLTYQWEASRDGVNWTASTAAGSQTDTISGITVTEDRIGRWYRCRVTDTNGAEIVSSHVMIRRPFDTWEYTYNADGLRVGKTNTETTYQYYYNGDKLSRMTVNGEDITFGYDANGAPQYVIYGGHRYFYLTNLQGDVTGIVSMDGEIVVAYSYDAWGNPMPATGEMADTLGKDNPLRYRGYIYDEETGLYYLQSRYYDPQIGRFINADVYTSTGQGLLGNNMFAYCGNNPVTRCDTEGDSWTAIGIGVAVAGITGLANGYSSYISGGKFWPAFWVGVGAGTAGYALSFLTNNPLALVGIRSLTSLGSDMLTAAVNNGKVSSNDWAVSSWDAIMDGVFSTLTYFYNPSTGDFMSNVFNAVLDGITDITETWLFSTPENTTTPQSQSSSTRQYPRNYVAFGEPNLIY